MPDRGETYIRVHDSMPDHHKIEGLSDSAFRLLVTTWCWCSRQRNEGRFALSAWRRRGSARARAELEAAGLVEVTEGVRYQNETESYLAVMHDFLYWQRSNEEITDRREKRRRAGSLGNHTRWHLGKGVVDPECEHCAHGPNGVPSGIANGSQVGSQTDRKPVAEQNRAEQRSTYRDLGGKAPVEERASERASEDDEKPQQQSQPRPARGPDVYAQAAHSGRAHRLVEDYAKTCRRRPPSSVLAKLGVEADKLLDEQWSTDEVSAALAALGAKGLGPGALASVAHELANSERDDDEPRDPWKVPVEQLTDDDVEAILGPDHGGTGPPPEVMAQGLEAMRAWNRVDIPKRKASRRQATIDIREGRLKLHEYRRSLIRASG